MFSDSATLWYDEYCEKEAEEKRTYLAFILFMRAKLIPSTAKDDLWKKWLGCHNSQPMES